MIQVCGGLATSAVVALGLLVAPVALAQLPGSANDQYTESVPTAGGDEPSTGGGGNGGGNGGSANSGGGEGGTSSATDTPAAEAPVTETPATDTSAGVTEASATDQSSASTGGGGGNVSSASGDRQGSGSGSGGQASQPDEAPLKPLETTVNSTPASSTAGSESDDGGGLGIGLPIALGLLLVAAIGYLLYRRRSADPTTARQPSTGRGPVADDPAR